MLRTEIAYKKLMGKWFWLTLPFYLTLIIGCSIFMFQVKEEIQDSLLSIMSITFPLIAGFLTFGRDNLRDLKNKIGQIKNDDENDIGRPTSNSDKIKIKNLKNLSDQFIGIVISTFFISFILILILLVSKTNEYTFMTSNNFINLYDYIHDNWINLVLKVIFVYLIIKMLFNTLFLTIYIIYVSNNEDLIK